MVDIGLGVNELLSDFQCGAGDLDAKLVIHEGYGFHQLVGFVLNDSLLLLDAVFDTLILGFEILHHFYGAARIEDVEEFCAVFSSAQEGGFLMLVLFQSLVLGHEAQELVFVLAGDAVTLQLVQGGVVGGGLGGGAHGRIACCNVLSVSLLSMVKV